MPIISVRDPQTTSRPRQFQINLGFPAISLRFQLRLDSLEKPYAVFPEIGSLAHKAKSPGLSSGAFSFPDSAA
jgi:hypothetical protein